jgi:DNA (cytosine-5)-methyltransferase 1
MTASMTLRLVELYCGIGGCAAAVAGTAEVVAALDVNRVALGVYRANFTHPAAVCALESIRDDDPRLRRADVWWLSPPCQPYTRRGLARDLDDPRSASLAHLLRVLERLQPPALALENVPGFQGSRAHERLLAILDRCGYSTAERLLCPTELGDPNRRRRFYLVASRERLEPWRELPPVPLRPLAGFLDPEDHPELMADPAVLGRYAHAADVVDSTDPAAVSATFTSAYGRSQVRSGSYLRRWGVGIRGTAPVLRLFSPVEILRLLGFPDTFRLPSELPLDNAWRLVGNSLSVPAVREALSALPGLTAAAPAPAAHRMASTS